MTKVKHTTISVSKELYEQLKSFCNKEGYNISKLTEKIIREFIENKQV